jgi:hypothetical protein
MGFESLVKPYLKPSPFNFGALIILLTSVFAIAFRAMTHFNATTGVWSGYYAFLAAYFIVFPIIFGIAIELILYKYVQSRPIVLMISFLFWIVVGFIIEPAVVGI